MRAGRSPSPFVTLGYATTEHGAQGITTDESITLVTDATTQRGVYVGATRGRRDNTIHVIADDLEQACERLERVITTDRIDIPAIEQWQRLTQRAGCTTPTPTPRTRSIERQGLGL